MKNLHYEFTGETIEFLGKTLHRIKATKDLPKHGVKKGDLGGWIEKEDNLQDSAWVGGKAKVYGNAKVYNNASIQQGATISEQARVKNEAVVTGCADVKGEAMIYDCAVIDGNATVEGKAIVCDNAMVTDNVLIKDNAFVCGYTLLENEVVICDGAIIKENAQICDYVEVGGVVIVGGDIKIRDYVKFYGSAVISSYSDFCSFPYYLDNSIDTITFFKGRLNDILVTDGEDKAISLKEFKKKVANIDSKKLSKTYKAMIKLAKLKFNIKH